MKFLYKFLSVVLLALSVNTGFGVTTVTNTLTNFSIEGGGTKFKFDIYTLRTSAPDFRMGQSTYVVQYTAGTMNNPVLTNVNPKYTVGSVTGSYSAMGSGPLFSGNRNLYVQVFYTGGSGDVISNDPGFNGLGERICTVTLNILSPVAITMSWDPSNSDVVSPGGLETAASTWVGFFSGTLPVELANFNSSVLRNVVSLSWSTNSEVNNSGFEIERKSIAENSDWTKVGFVNGSGTSHDPKSYVFKDNGLTIGKYNYRLKQIDFNGNFEYFSLENEVVVGVPDRFELGQNYPNPFNPSTKINFSLPSDSRVTLSIFDISGRTVATLLNNEFRAADYYTVEFNGSNLSSGAYFYSLRTDRNSETKKMILVK